LILGLLWFQKADTRPGILFLRFAALTSGARLFLEAFRGDSTLMFGGLRMAQVIAWAVLAISLFLLDRRSRDSISEVVIRSEG
jgi:prolipoprotein diacylglyceryltransferase